MSKWTRIILFLLRVGGGIIAIVVETACCDFETIEIRDYYYYA